MANIVSTSQAEAACPTSRLNAEGAPRAEVVHPHSAWILLDEASEDLVRVEAIVDLLGSEMQASRHQLYAAQIAGEFLRAASERVTKALEIVRDIDLASRRQETKN